MRLEMPITRTSRDACAALGVVMLAGIGCGGSDADEAGSFRPKAADLQRFVLAKADLPDGYKAVDRKDSSKPAGCVDLGDPDADREYEERLAPLGFKRCAHTLFERVERKVGELERLNEPSSEAILMRDERAASAALPALRRRLRTALTSRGGEVHSVAAPALGDEAPRGLTLSFGIEDIGVVGAANAAHPAAKPSARRLAPEILKLRPAGRRACSGARAPGGRWR